MKIIFNTYFPILSIFFLILFLNQDLNAQQHRELFIQKYSLSRDSAKAYTKLLLQSDRKDEIAFGHISKGYICTKEGDYEKAKKEYDLGFLAIDKIDDTNLQSIERLNALYYYSLYLLVKHEMEEANKKIQEGLKLAIKLNDAKMQITFTGLIGRSYSLSNLGEQAIAYGVETIRSMKALKSELSIDYYQDELLRTYLNTAYRALNYYAENTTENKSYLDSTSAYAALAESFIKEENFQPSGIRKRQLLNLKSDIAYNREDYKKAIGLYQKTMEASKSLGMKKRVYQLKFRLAECYFELGDYQKAKNLFDEISAADLKRYKLIKNAVSIKFYYSQIYLQLGDLEKSRKYADTFNIQIEDFYKTMSSTAVDVFAQNELNEKQRILSNLAEKEKTNSYLTVFLTSIFIFSVLLLFYTRNQRRKFQVKINDLLKNLENNTSEKSTSAITINESKAKKLLLKLQKIEEQELFLSKNYSLNMVAKKIGSNSSYVSQIINTYWNKSFVEYTNELRINYILKKLKEDSTYQKFTLLAIAESIGYKSLSSFNKHFKNIAGITPKQYLNYLKTHTEK